MPRLYVMYDTTDRISPMAKVSGIYQAMLELPEGLDWETIGDTADELITLLISQFVESKDGQETPEGDNTPPKHPEAIHP